MLTRHYDVINVRCRDNKQSLIAMPIDGWQKLCISIDDGYILSLSIFHVVET